MTNDLPAWELASALPYLAGLQPLPAPLAVDAAKLVGVRIQPTVGPMAAALLNVLVRSLRPRRILEIGTSYGYATCILGHAAASYGGTVLTLEQQPPLVNAARENLAAAGLTHTVEVRLGDARDLAPMLEGTFGLIVQDGGKDDYLPLLDALVTRLEPGGLLFTDDVLFPVMPIPPSVKHWQNAVAAYNSVLVSDSRLQTVWLPIGDGVALSVRLPT